VPTGGLWHQALLLAAGVQTSNTAGHPRGQPRPLAVHGVAQPGWGGCLRSGCLTERPLWSAAWCFCTGMHTTRPRTAAWPSR
jgi:hypothetical protein